MTADTIDVPVVGNVKTNTLIGVGVATALVVGYMYVKSAKNATVEDAPVDPNADNSTGTFGADIGSGSGGYYATPSAASDTDLPRDVIATNAEWVNDAVEKLSSAGRDAVTVQNALGKYLAGSPLTTAEKTIVQAAKAVSGNPPIAAPPMTGVSPAPAPSTVALIAPKTVGHEKIGPNFIIVKWSAVPSAKSYEVDFRNSKGQGRVEGSGADLVETFSGLKPSTPYRFKVRAINSRGVRGPWSQVHTITTAKG